MITHFISQLWQLPRHLCVILLLGSLAQFSNAMDVSVSDLVLIEGQTLNAEVTISEPAGADGQVILYELAGASNGAGSADVEVASGRITIAAGKTSGNISIEAVSGDGNEDVFETLSLGVRIDHVINSGFENGSNGFKPLDGNYTGSSPYKFEINSEHTYSGNGKRGNKTLEVDAESQGYQDLTIKPGSAYTVSLKASRRTSGAPNVNPIKTLIKVFEIGNEASPILEETVSRNNTSWEWKTFSYTIPANHNATNVRLQFTTNHNQTLGMIIDDLSMAAIPELNPGKSDGLTYVPDAAGQVTIIDSSAAGTPTPVIFNAPAYTNAPFEVDIKFTRAVTGFEQADIQVNNLVLSNFKMIDASNYQVTVTPDLQGKMTLLIPADIANDQSSGVLNAQSSLVESTFDSQGPELVNHTWPQNITGEFLLTLTFDEDVAVLEESELIPNNATISEFIKVSQKEYSVKITPLNINNPVSLSLAEGVVSDVAGNNNKAENLKGAFDHNSPVITSANSVSVKEDETNTGLLLTATDADGETPTFEIDSSAEDDSNFFQIIEAGVAPNKAYTLALKNTVDYENPADKNTDGNYNVTVIASSDRLSSNQIITVTILNVDEAISFTVGGIETANLNENVAYSQQATLSQPLNGAVTWALDPASEAAGFSLSNTGLLSLEAKDFETDAATYTAKVTVEDADSNRASKTITLTLKDVTEASTLVISNIASGEVNENSAYSSSIPAVAGNIGDVVWSKGGADADLFTQKANGQLKMAEKNFEDGKTSFNVTVIATDADGNKQEVALVITLKNVVENGAVFGISGNSENQAENAAYEQTLAVSGTPNGSITWSLEDNAAGFAVDQNGKLTLAAQDFESSDTKTRTVTVTITDQDGIKKTLPITVTVTNVVENGAVFGISGSSENQAENAAYEQTLSVTGTPNGSITWSLEDNAAGFAVDQNGKLTLAAQDFESSDTKTRTVTVTITDQDGIKKTLPITVTVTNVVENGAVFGISGNSENQAENAAYEQTLAVSGTPNGSITWSLEDNAAGFAVDQNGKLTLAAQDFESSDTKTRTVTVTITDQDGIKKTLPITVTVTNVVENGAVFGISGNSENQAENAAYEQTLAVSGTPNGSITWSLEDNAAGFAVDQNGKLTLAAQDFESSDTKTRTVTVTITDQDGIKKTLPITVTVTNVVENGAVFGISGNSENQAENAAYEQTLAVSGTPNGSITWNLEDNAAGFAVDQNGKLTLAAQDFESSDTKTRTVTVTITDQDGIKKTLPITVTVTNVVENGAVFGISGNSENQAENAAYEQTLSVTGTPNGSITWSLEDNAAGFAIDQNGKLTLAAQDFESSDTKTRTVTVTITDQDGIKKTLPITVTVTNVVENGAVFGISGNSENQAENAAYEQTLAVSGTPNGSITWSLEDNAAGFAVDQNGKLTLAAQDFESSDTKTRTVTVTITDQDGIKKTLPITVTVTNVVENGAVFGISGNSENQAENAAYEQTLAVSGTPNGSITWSLEDNAAGFAVDQNGKLTLAAQDFESSDTKTRTVTVTITDQDGIKKTLPITVTVTNVVENGAVFGISGNSENQAENAAYEQTLAVSGTPNGSITWSLEDNAAGFAVDQNGKLTLAAQDFESSDTKTRTVTVTITDQDGIKKTLPITVTVTNVVENGAVFGISGNSENQAENAAYEQTLAVSGTPNGSITWNLEDNAAGFAIDQNGKLTLAAQDFESSDIKTRTVTVTITDQDGIKKTLPITVTVTNVVENGAVFGISGNSENQAENAAYEQTLAVSGTPNGSITWSLEDNAAGFAVDQNGKLTLAAQDFESSDTKTRTVTVTITDQDGIKKTLPITVTVTNVVENGAVFGISGNSENQAENAAYEQTLAVSGTPNGSITWNLEDNAAGFAIDQNGKLTLAAQDFESSDIKTRTVTVTITDQDGIKKTLPITVTVTNVDENGAVFGISGNSENQAENAAYEQTLAVSGTPNGSITWNLEDNAAGFAIDQNGKLTLAAQDFESSDIKTRTVTVTITDQDGIKKTLPITVTVTNVVENGAVFGISGNSENQAENAAYEQTLAVSGTPNGSITWSLEDNAAGFAVDQNGKLTLAAQDFESSDTKTRTVTVTITDQDGIKKTLPITVTVTNVVENGAVFGISGNSENQAENAAYEQTLAVSGTPNGSITWNLEDNAAGFAIDQNGKLTLAAQDFESSDIKTRTVTVTITDQDGIKKTLPITVTVTNVDDNTLGDISDINNAANQIIETAAISELVGITANAIDLDGDINPIVYSLNNHTDLFNIDSKTGVIRLKVLAQLNATAVSSYQISVSANNGVIPLTPKEKTFTIAVLEDATDTDQDGTRDHVDTSPADPCIPSTEAGACDKDKDGKTNAEETGGIPATNPNDPDSDNDGICDGALAVAGQCSAGPDANPTDPDADDDGVCDGNLATEGVCAAGPDSEPNNPDNDTDGDGTSNKDEKDAVPATDPTNPDTDNDGVCDGVNAVNGTCTEGPDTNPTDACIPSNTVGACDADKDGKTNAEETGGIPATNPNDPDSDNDGICDGALAVAGQCSAGPDANPTDPDADDDGVCDGNLATEGVCATGPDSEPNNPDNDTDGDGTSNKDEKDAVPATDPTNPDTDNDGVCDGVNAVNGTCTEGPDTNPTDACIPSNTVGACDADKDGKTNAEETGGIPATNPNDPDSDNDGICDGALAVAGQCSAGPDANPTDPDADDDGVCDGNLATEGVCATGPDSEPNNPDNDTDGDGTSNKDEKDAVPATDPTNPDTDNDGVCDGVNAVNGTCTEGPDTNPTDACIPSNTVGACDADKDGKTNAEETGGIPATNPNDPDSDNDGICDGALAVAGQCSAGPDANPTDPDADDDGVCDGNLATEGVCATGPDSEPNNPDNDTDGDGTSNKDEKDAVPATDPTNPDTDNDGVCDGVNAVNGTCTEGPDTNPTDACIPSNTVGACDADKDGKTNAEETGGIPATNPNDPDSDNDGICDGALAVAGQCSAGPDANPTDPDADDDGVCDGNLATEGVCATGPDSEPNNPDNDTDGDGTSNKDEKDAVPATDPTNPDTDNDGVCDGVNAVNGTCTEGPDTNPTDACIPSNTVGACDADKDGKTNAEETGGIPATNPNDPDSDNDGICDGALAVAGQCSAGPDANPTDPDADDDGVCDGNLATEGVCATGPDSEPNNPDNDTDGDGTSNKDEKDAVPATDPTNPDTDNDGVCDGVNAVNGTCTEGPDTNPTDACIPSNTVGACDADKDGKTNAEETGGIPATNPNDPDSDNDGICDGALAVAGQCSAGPDANPTDPDADDNGICDGANAVADDQGNPICMPAPSPGEDTDNDGTNDDDESIGDTDGDGIPDYLDPASDGPGFGDSDFDGIDDKLECGDSLPCRNTDGEEGYDFLDKDSDNDGISDDEEADGIFDNFAEGMVTEEDLVAGNDLLDSDGDNIPNYRDIDSDNDGTDDENEIENPHDANNPKDTDDDGIPDSVDPDSDDTNTGGGDSDNDGISDEEECPEYPNCPDEDNDGKPDYIDSILDSDSDGISDGDEDPNLDNDNDPATNPRDTDGDGIPDYQDTDSDGDGISDEEEANPKGKDTDQDGIPDVIDSTNGDGDADNDGIPDSTECGNVPCRDTDGDGIPDYTDTDSDGDGIDDKDEAGDDPKNPKDTDGDGIPDIADPINGEEGENGGDSDKDGVADALECKNWPNCVDTDRDGIPDYLDGDSSPVVAPTPAPEAPSEDERGEVTTGVHGAGSISWLFLAGLVVLVALRRRSFIVLSLFFTTFAANAAWWEDMDLYAGAGIGQSYLDPEVGNTAYDVDDHTQTAWKLTGGWDWNDYISVEGYYSDLGRVDLGHNSELGYRMIGGDAMLHYWVKGGERLNGSIALYAKAGLNHMTNKGKNVNYDSKNQGQIFGGVGAELYLPKRFSVRFEIESYDTDASLLSLNIVKRFGFKSRKTSLPVAEKPVEQDQFVAMVDELPATAAGPKVIQLAPVVRDTDLDGLLDDEDQCPYTPDGVTVNELGCATYLGKVGELIANVQFEVNSSALTEPSKIALNEISDMLVTYKAVQIEVQAHSDNTGRAEYNKALSQKRAESVVHYLEQKNIASDRLDAQGYGEEKPIADNNTIVGRATNRRVEFILKAR